MATPAQIKLIKTAQRELDLDDCAYRSMMHALIRKTSSKALTTKEASVLISEMKKKGLKIKRKPADNVQPATCNLPENTIRLASKSQWHKIYRMQRMIAWSHENPGTGMQLFFQKRLGMKRIKTMSEAFKAIEGLKGIFESQMRAAFGDDWATLPHTDPDIIKYIEEHKKGGNQ